jgi:Amidohydrolase family
MSGRVAGRLRQWPDSGGTVTTSYSYNDRGRGPALRQTLKVDRGGLPVAMQLSGTDYLKAPVREQVALAAGPLLTWRNDAAAGRAAPGAGFYLPEETLPTDVAALARAMLQVVKRTVPILPAGVATMTSGDVRTVTAGGRSLRVTPHLISGLGLTPEPIWLDADGKLFASGSTWQMVIRRGFESVQPMLIAAQLAASRARDSVTALRLARTPKRPVAIIHANLFDAASRSMKPAQSVIVRGDKIEAVGDDGTVAIPADAEVIDAGGKALIPGLWDMHVHVQDDDGIMHIAAGVTTVRDLANDTDELIARRTRFNSGTLIGPRVLLGGFMDGPGPYAGPTKVLIANRDAARVAVENYANLGYEQIKVYSSLDPSIFPTVVRTAHGRGLRVSGHVPNGMTAEQFVRAGADEIQHANFLFLNFLADSNIDTRTPARFTAVARSAASLDLRSDRVQKFIALLKEKDVVVDPTLNVFENMFTARSGTLDPGSLPIAIRMPPVARRSLLGGGLPVTRAQDDVYRNSFINMERMVKRLHDAGVRLVAGTDNSAGFSLHRELELYSEAGIPNTDILYIATLGAARVMKHDAEWGSLAPGKFADLMLVDGDPSQRMRDLRRAEFVMKGGVMYIPDSLYASVNVKPAPRKGSVAAREVGAEDVVCRGPAAVVKKGSNEPVPLNCTVVDSSVSGARNRGAARPGARPGSRTPARRAPAPKVPARRQATTRPATPPR